MSLGGLAEVKISSGNLELLHLIKDLKEPRGLSASDNRLAFSLENQVIVVDPSGTYTFSDPWFSYIHTVSFHPLESTKVLVSSSGLDVLFEYDYRMESKVWEWFAWENGIYEAHSSDGDSLYLTRQKAQHEDWLKAGQKHLYISNPSKDHLPTAKRAAFINTASYEPDGNILATFFHEGSVRHINRASGESSVVLDGLKNPHGGFRVKGNKILATNTGKGQLWLKDEAGIQQYIGENLPDKAPEMLNAEWWQNAIAWGDLFVVIDSNRNCLLILDPKHELYDRIPYDANWALQDLVLLNGSEPDYREALEQFSTPLD